MTAETQGLKDVGLKITHPRLKIMRLLLTSDVRHVSAEDVYRLLLGNNEEIGLATVYRVLTQFESAGLVTRHHFEGGHSVFELSPEHHHDHIVCIKCGHVTEFADPDIEAKQSEIAKRLGFELTDHDLNMYGICADCR
jgi:Fur family ferric uptake transcriptional regulator